MDWMETFLTAVAVISLAVEIVGVTARGLGYEWGRAISITLREDGCRWLAWPYLWGALGGHFFGPVLSYHWNVVTFSVLLASFLVIVATDLHRRAYVARQWLFPVMLAGLIAGITLWPQT